MRGHCRSSQVCFLSCVCCAGLCWTTPSSLLRSSPLPVSVSLYCQHIRRALASRSLFLACAYVTVPGVCACVCVCVYRRCLQEGCDPQEPGSGRPAQEPRGECDTHTHARAQAHRPRMQGEEGRNDKLRAAMHDVRACVCMRARAWSTHVLRIAGMRQVPTLCVCMHVCVCVCRSLVTTSTLPSLLRSTMAAALRPCSSAHIHTHTHTQEDSRYMC